MRATLILIAGLICVAPMAANAASLPIMGKYGDKSGCHYARTGDSDGADVFFLLTSEDVTSAASFCEVKSVGAPKGSDIPVVFACKAEGEDGATDSAALLKPSGKNAYTIAFDDGSVWGPLKRCK